MRKTLVCGSTVAGMEHSPNPKGCAPGTFDSLQWADAHAHPVRVERTLFSAAFDFDFSRYHMDCIGSNRVRSISWEGMSKNQPRRASELSPALQRWENGENNQVPESLP
jgi:hypothetical protein